MLSFDSPMWLWGLCGWFIASVLLLAGQLHVEHVPFVRFWRGPVGHPKMHQAIHRPPVFVVLLILSLGLMVLSAARPVWVKPSPVPQNATSSSPVKIESVVPRQDGAAMAQLMIDLTGKATATVQIDDQPAQDVRVDGARRLFVDLPDRRDRFVVSAGVSRVEVTRVSRQPRFEVRGDVSPAVMRMVELYSNRHRPDADAPLVLITRSPGELAGRNGVIVGRDRVARQAGPWSRSDSPLVSQLQLPQSMESSIEMPAGFAPALSGATGPVLAERSDGTTRQIWVGIDDRSFESTPGFVILWTNLLDRFADTSSGWLSKSSDAQPTVAALIPPARDLTMPLIVLAGVILLSAAILWPSTVAKRAAGAILSHRSRG